MEDIFKRRVDNSSLFVRIEHTYNKHVESHDNLTEPIKDQFVSIHSAQTSQNVITNN